jgi:hypothetical protein
MLTIGMKTSFLIMHDSSLVNTILKHSHPFRRYKQRSEVEEKDMIAQIAKPPESSCLGSPAASNVPFPSILKAWAELPADGRMVTLCPLSFINATIPSSNPRSRNAMFGVSWSCKRGWERAWKDVMFRSSTFHRLCIVAVVMREPPAAPTTK